MAEDLVPQWVLPTGAYKNAPTAEQYVADANETGTIFKSPMTKVNKLMAINYGDLPDYAVAEKNIKDGNPSTLVKKVQETY